MATHQKIRKAVIPIAGWGTRMFPASKAMPKALFPIVDKDGFCKPVIQVIIEEALSALGDDAEICIVVQHGQQEPIEAYFNTPSNAVYLQKPELKAQAEKLQNIGKRLTFALQEKQEGFGHAVLCAKDVVGNEPFLVLLGDHVYVSYNNQTCAQTLVDVYNKHGKSATTLETCPESELSVNGIVIGDKVEGDSVLNLTDTVEKPSVEYAREHLWVPGLPDNEYLCYFGIDLLTPKVFDILQQNYDNNIRTKGELQLRDAMGQLMKEEGMIGLRIQGKRHDTGMPHPYADTIHVFNQISLQKK
jgi:UTP--glucose-1-phosphate uridylyltransferase